MPRKAKELSAIEITRLTEPGLHFVGGVSGLALQVAPSGARTWVMRVMVGGKRREIGLGGYSQTGMTLAKAREKALANRELITQGVDPVERNRTARSELRAAIAKALTFEQCAESYIESHRKGWKNAKHAQQWTNTLTTYAYPVMGSLLVKDITVSHVLKAIEPIWSEKTETASRVRNRIELVLGWATARGYREGLNPARWRDHLDKLLPAPSKVTESGHHAAIGIDQAFDFMTTLRGVKGQGARALEFVILTAARSGEVRNSTWSEIDLSAKMWIVPAARMKAGREHRVPLSDAAIDLLNNLPRIAGSDLVFPGSKGALSDMTLNAVMRRLGANAVPHGFRSTFRDWASERTAYPSEAAEMALAHKVTDKVEAAYRRGDLLEKRRRMMNDWAAFLVTPPATGNVIAIKAA